MNASPSAKRHRESAIEVLEARIAPASANLTLSIQAPDDSNTGERITYLVTVVNSGPDAATDVVVMDDFPIEARFVSTHASQGSANRAGGTVTAALGTIASGSSATLEVIVEAPSVPDLLTNHGSVTSAISDPETGDNDATANTRVLLPGDLAVTPLGSRPAQALIDAILGTGITVSNVQYTGNADSSGTFAGPTHIIGFDEGIVLSSGRAVSVVGPNTDAAITTINGLPGDSDLNGLTTATTQDATVLEFDFVPKRSTLFFQYVFSSDEYNEYANTQFNDVFGFFVNGTNVALLPGTSTPVAINNVNGGNPLGTDPQHPQFYVNNDIGLIKTEMDGMTVVFSVQANVNVGVVNHIKLAIADTSDSRLDSNVFIRGGSFTDKPPNSDLQVTLSKTSSIVGAGLNLSFTAKVVNKGPDKAFGVLLSDLLPAGVQLVSATTSQGTTTNNNGNVVTNIGALARGASATVTLVVTPTVIGPLTLTSTVTGSVEDPKPANNQASATFDVQVVHPIFIGAGSGSKVNVINSLDGGVLNQFNAFGPSFNGGVRVATGDVNGDGVADIIAGVGTGGQGRVRVFDGKNFSGDPKPILDFRPFGSGYLGGVYVAAGDVNGDGKADLIVSTSAGSASEVRVFDLYTGLQNSEPPTLLTKFKASAKVQGGVRVAAGDLDGNGHAEIVATNGINATVKVFSGNGTPFAGALQNFQAFSEKVPGLSAAVGDFDDDGDNDLVFGTASDASIVRILPLSAAGTVLGTPRDFTAFGSSNGLRLAATDVNGDGIADIIAAQGRGGGSVRLFNGIDQAELLDIRLGGSAGHFVA